MREKTKKMLSWLLVFALVLCFSPNLEIRALAEEISSVEDIDTTNEEITSEEITAEDDATFEEAETTEEISTDEADDSTLNDDASTVVYEETEVTEDVTEEVTEVAEDATEETSEEAAEATEDITEDTSEEDTEEPKAVAFAQSQFVNFVLVSVTADEGVFPEGAVLNVTSVSNEVAEAEGVKGVVDAKRDNDKNVAFYMTYDISIYDAEGNEIEPDTTKGNVSVSFKDIRIVNQNLDTDVYHIVETESGLVANELNAVNSDEITITAQTDGFSYYTVEFTYNNLEYELNGDEAVALSTILEAVGLTGNVTDVCVSNDSLFTASNESGEWVITALNAFDTEEWMKVTIDGVVYEITVTDDIDTPQEEQGANIMYKKVSSGFDVRGGSDGSIGTTYGNGGYKTAIIVNEGEKKWLENDFKLGKIYTVDDVETYIKASINSSGNAVIITYVIKNNNNEAATVKLGTCADTQVAGNDNAPVKLSGNGLGMANGNNSFAVIPGNGAFTTRWFGAYYGDAYYENYVFDNNDSTGEFTGDSAVAWSWTINLAAGQTVTKTAFLTLGALTECTVKFDGNGGTGAMDDLPVYEGVGLTITKNKFTRDGYKFIGWAKTSAATEPDYEDEDEITVENDITLYAVWEKKLDQVITADDISMYVDDESTLKAACLDNADMTYEIVSGDDTIEFDESIGKVTAKKAGKAVIKICAAETEKYCSAEKTITITIIGIPVGEETFDVKPSDGVPAVVVNNDKDKLIDTVTTDEDKAKVEKGADVNVYLTVDAADKVSSDDTSKMLVVASDGAKIGKTYDINLYKEITGEDIIQLHNTSTSVSLTLKVPDELINTDSSITRTYMIVRLHDGVAEVIPSTFDASTGQITFETNKFSIFSIIYKDTQKEIPAEVKTPEEEKPAEVKTPEVAKAPKTGDNTPIAILVMLLLDSSLGALYLTLRKRI